MASRPSRLDPAAWSMPLAAVGSLLALAGGLLLGAEHLVGFTLPIERAHWAVIAFAVAGGVFAGLGVAGLRWSSGVRRALRAFGSGERSVDALKIGTSRAGPGAAWNEMMEWVGVLHRSDRAERVIEAQAARTDRPGDDSLGSAVDALWMGMMLIDESLTIQEANGASGSLLRCEREQLIGKSFNDFVDDERVLKAVKSVAKGLVRRKCSVEVDRSSEDGGVSVLRFTVRPIRKTQISSVLMVIEDITQQHEADKARAELVAQAAHELRTPLTNIRLYTEELIDGFGEMSEAESGQALSVVGQETRRLERIVSDMLSMSEIEAGELSIVQDDVRMEDILEILRGDYTVQAREQGLSLSFDLSPKLPVLRGDRDKITLAMHNLISNAIKYTPPGGEVRVSADFDDERFVFEVADTGVGVQPEQLERVFDRFYRCRDERTAHVQGTGLGLALARDVARLHGGDVTAESVYEQGSRFTLELPAAA